MLICRFQDQHAVACVFRFDPSLSRDRAAESFPHKVARALYPGLYRHIADHHLHRARTDRPPVVVQTDDHLSLADIHSGRVVLCHCLRLAKRQIPDHLYDGYACLLILTHDLHIFVVK